MFLYGFFIVHSIKRHLKTFTPNKCSGNKVVHWITHNCGLSDLRKYI